jgi:hypothetical protein
LATPKFANVKIEPMILELNDYANGDVQEVSNLGLTLLLSHQTILQMLDTNIQEISNVVVHFKRLAFVDVLKSELGDLNYDIISTMTMQYLRSKFDGDVMFKLRPTKDFNNLVGLMQGMDKKHDIHP